MVLVSSVSLLDLWEIFPWGLRDSTLRRQEGGCLFGALVALSQHALLFSSVKPQDGEDGNKTEGKLFWVFSGPSSRPVCLFLCFLSEFQTFLLSGICFRGLKLSESVSGWCPSLIILGLVPAFIFSSRPLKIWAHQKASHAAGVQLASPFLPHASSNNTITKDPDFQSPLFSYTLSHF